MMDKVMAQKMENGLNWMKIIINKNQFYIMVSINRVKR